MTEPTIVPMDEVDAMRGQSVEIVAVGADAFIVRLEDGRLLAAAMCLGCGSHIGYYEVDADMLDISGGDLGSV